MSVAAAAIALVVTHLRLSGNPIRELGLAPVPLLTTLAIDEQTEGIVATDRQRETSSPSDITSS